MSNLVDQNNDSIEILKLKIDTLTGYIKELGKQNKLMLNKLLDISVHLNNIKNMNNSNDIKDGLSVLANEVAQLHNINNEYKLSGRDIYLIKKKTGISWAKMSIKYNIPISTLQYRYRQYRDKQFDTILTPGVQTPNFNDVQGE